MRPPRLLVAGPNLTIDRTSAITALRPGEVLRTGQVTVTPGGKGVNVVRAATALGAAAELAGFVPGRTGEAAAAMLSDEGVVLRAVMVGGEIRSTAILRDDAGRVTVLNEPGPPITEPEWAGLEALLARDPRPDVLVCSGSVPPGSPADAFGRLVAVGRSLGVPVVVDATGALLAGALAVGPDVVTPNLAEAERVLHGRPDEGVDVDVAEAPGRSLDAAEALRDRGARVAVVTAAEAGAAVATADGRRWLAAPRVTVRNPIGAGDAFTAGLAVALAAGASPLDAARAAVAAGSASVEHPLAGMLDPARARALPLGPEP